MNVYKREMKFNVKSTIFWIIGAIIIIVLSFSKFSVADEGQLRAMATMVNKMPDVMKAIYGMSGIDISTISGYSAIIINFVLIMMSLHGVFLGMSHIGVEKKNKTMDFIFVKPLNKKKILFHKLLAGLTLLLIFNIFISLSTIFSIKLLGSVSNRFIIRMISSFLVIDFFFYSIGVLLSVLSKKKKNGGIGASIFFVFYLLAIFSRMSDNLKFLEYITPLEILSGANVLKGFHLIMLFLILLISMGLLYISLNKIEERELL